MMMSHCKLEKEYFHLDERKIRRHTLHIISVKMRAKCHCRKSIIAKETICYIEYHVNLDKICRQSATREMISNFSALLRY